MRKKSKRQNANLGMDLGEKDEQVACRASALALAVADEACVEAKM